MSQWAKEEKPVYAFRKNALEEVRVKIVTLHDGKKMLDIRVFVENVSGEFVPTKKGIMFDIASLSELEKGVQALRKEIGEDTKTDLT